MNWTTSQFLSVFLPGLLLAFAIPAGVFFVCALGADMGLSGSLRATVEQFSAERNPLLGVATLGLIPVVLTTVSGWILARKLDRSRSRRIAQAGLAAVAVILVWVNFQFWPGYLPEKKFQGFPHGLEFVIGPIFFAPPAMLVGMLAAWFATRQGKSG